MANVPEFRSARAPSDGARGQSAFFKSHAELSDGGTRRRFSFSIELGVVGEARQINIGVG